ncbi:MAG TPA: hypothetical protein ENO23_09755, partial [Alphaproteobacteria bacterium]|nr:hypothetical protein [Alphaproteobacteria bacterium]
MGTYALLTRPERVRRFAEDYLADMTGGIVRIGDAHFDPFEGLRLTNVTVATHPDPAFDAAQNTYEDRILFASRHLQLKLQPFSVITGELVVPEILAVEPALRLLKDPETGSRNWQHLLRKRRTPRERRRGRAERLPTIRLRNASVELAWLHPSEDHISTRLQLDITATAAADPTAYVVRWRTRSEPIEDGRFELDLGRLVLRTAEGGLPTIPIDSVRWASPLELERWLDLLDLRGQIRTDSLAYSRDQGGRAEITVESASVAIPLDDQERRLPRDERYLSFADVAGRLAFERDAVTVRLTGRWRDGTCLLDGRITADPGAIRSLDDV